MATGDFAKGFAEATMTMPIRRDLLSINPSGSFAPTFYSSALYARSWLDPSPSDTDNAFRVMVDGVLSNAMTTENAIKDINAKLNLLFIK